MEEFRTLLLGVTLCQWCRVKASMPRRLASLLALACSPCASVAFIPPLTRREALLTSGAAFAASAPALPAFAAAAAVTAAATPLQAAWTATDGFSDASFINFDEGAYAAMRDDEKRTPLFERAIQQRLAAAPANTLTVLDLGTGPFALLALAAARAGAKKVYTIEANKEAAKRARDALRSARVSNVEVIEGFSTAISLPEKVDVLVAEIAGSVASEEGAYATIRDAQARFLKRPYDPASYIPARIETLAASACNRPWLVAAASAAAPGAAAQAVRGHLEPWRSRP